MWQFKNINKQQQKIFVLILPSKQGDKNKKNIPIVNAVDVSTKGNQSLISKENDNVDTTAAKNSDELFMDPQENIHDLVTANPISRDVEISHVVVSPLIQPI